jgi:hypothetical protein
MCRPQCCIRRGEVCRPQCCIRRGEMCRPQCCIRRGVYRASTEMGSMVVHLAYYTLSLHHPTKHALTYQFFSSTDEIIKHVLLLVQRPVLVPLFTILPPPAQIHHGQHAAKMVKPPDAHRTERGGDANVESTVAIHQRRGRRCRRILPLPRPHIRRALLADDKHWNARAVGGVEEDLCMTFSVWRESGCISIQFRVEVLLH